MFLKLYLIALPIFFAVDMAWLGFAAKRFYARHLGSLMRSDINWTAAILFYLFFIAGLVIFVISPAVERAAWTRALLYGAIFGLISYATYDLTNLATLRDFPAILAIVDMIWGAVLASTVSAATTIIALKIRL